MNYFTLSIQQHSDKYPKPEPLMKSSLTENPDLDTILPVCIPALARLTRIFVFQFFTAIILTVAMMVSYGTLPWSNYTQCAYISLAMFLAFVFAGQLSGGQGNPIITIALLFTPGSNVTALSFIIYIVAQFVGSIVGGAIGYGAITQYSAPLSDQTNLPLTFGSQLIGTFIFITLYLMIMSSSTKLQSNFMCYLLVPLAYYISNMLTYQYTGTNPATILANFIFYGVKYNNWAPIQTYWAFIIGPLVGGVIATVFCTYFLIPLHRKWVSRAAQ